MVQTISKYSISFQGNIFPFYGIVNRVILTQCFTLLQSTQYIQSKFSSLCQSRWFMIYQNDYKTFGSKIIAFDISNSYICYLESIKL